MSESVIHRNESDYPWEVEPDDAHRAARIRVRTFVSGGRTATSGLSMGVFEMPPGAVLDPHRHHPQEVYYVTAGEAEVYLDGEWRPLRTATSCTCPATRCTAPATAGRRRARSSGSSPPTPTTRSSTSVPEGLARSASSASPDAGYRRGMWLDLIDEPLVPRPALPGPCDGRRGDRRGGLHGPLGGLLPAEGRPSPARHRARAPDRRLRRLGAQRRLGVAVVPGFARGDRQGSRPRAGRRHAARDVRHRRRGRAGRGGRGHRGALSPRRGAHAGDRPRATRPRARAARPLPPLGRGRGRDRLARLGGGTRAFGRRGVSRRVVPHALRLRRPGAPRPRPGTCCRAARRTHPRAHAGAAHRGRTARHRRGRGARRGRRAGHRRVHARAARSTPRAHPRLLPGHRHRAAAGRRLGRDRLERPRDVHRRPPPLRLRDAHRRRPHRDRRPRRPVPLRLEGARGVRRRARASTRPRRRPSSSSSLRRGTRR